MTDDGMQKIEHKQIKKPVSITVFGVLNIIYGGLFILLTPISIFGYIAEGWKGDISYREMTWSLFNIIIGFGVTIWLVILGIGLLKLKKWARRGCVVYGWVDIVYILLAAIADIIFISLGWIKMFSNEGMLANISTEFLNIVISLIYPVLLLIFMKTRKVRQAFAGIENE